MMSSYAGRAIAMLVAALTLVTGAGTSKLQSAVTASAVPAPRTTLRVGMGTLWHDREVVMSPEKGTTIKVCERCAKRSLAQPATLRAESKGRLTLLISGQATHADRVQIDGAVTIKAHGESETLHHPVTISGRNGMVVIAVTLPVETYVEQVVASESGPADSMESLKALAVVVRSFALHEAHGHANYDLCDSTHCQLLHWHGVTQRQAAAQAATLETSGETLWFHERPALAYFNKDCGGRSASNSELWPRAAAVSYLGSEVDRYCVQSDSRAWSADLTRAELSNALASHGVAATGWQHISVQRRGASGRAVTLLLDGTEIGAEDFRIAVGESLGWNQIPSTWFEVSQQGDRVAFHGRGWGHGVGLCQKGASVMAAQGRSAAEILAQYFAGAYAADESTGHPWIKLTGARFTVETLDSTDAVYLPELARARAEASQRSGLNTKSAIVVRAFASTPAFRNATLAPGWVAAFTEGDWIATQPLKTLSARRLLEDTMRHEFLHVLVEENAGSGAPLWLREGLVELWSASAHFEAELHARIPAMTTDAVSKALTGAESEAQSTSAHRHAAAYAARLIARHGQAQVLEWLRSGIPAGALAAITQR
jgi:stage II sporulation protein D